MTVHKSKYRAAQEMALAEELSFANANSRVTLEKAISITLLPAVPPPLTLAGIVFAIFLHFPGIYWQPIPRQGWKESPVEDGRNCPEHTVACFRLGREAQSLRGS